MPSPKIFVSSTCYDLAMAREQIRSFILRLGYELVMSEYSDVLYDPRAHTHTSCLQEVPNADLVVMIIGSRFGGKIVPDALSSVDIENLISSSFNVAALSEPEKLSITQLEVLKAIDSGVPVFAFVNNSVMHDHYVYQRNRDLIDQIKFPSIEKAESAKYIFEFINFLSHRTAGNSVITFEKIGDIEEHLSKQWGALFQKLLREQRDHVTDGRKVAALSEQIDDLKAALISTLSNAQSRDVARGVIRYRRLVDVLSGLNINDISLITENIGSFASLLASADVESIVDFSETSRTFGRTALLKSDHTFYEIRFGSDFLSRVSMDWQSFIELSCETRKIIFDALVENGRIGPSTLRYRSVTLEEFASETQDLDIKELNPISIDVFFGLTSSEGES